MRPILSRGKDIPSSKNDADYTDKIGRIDLLRFFTDHQFSFPTLFVKCKCESAQKLVEVGCERFFASLG